MIKNTVILALLTMLSWQHWQDTKDRQTVLSYLQGSRLHIAYKPCGASNSIKNAKQDDSVESPEIQEQ